MGTPLQVHIGLLQFGRMYIYIKDFKAAFETDMM